MNNRIFVQTLFKRHRRSGDIVFALFFLFFSLFLVSQIAFQTKWFEGTKLFVQPAFWPAISLCTMLVFAFLHWLSSALSRRIPGRLQEVLFWGKSFEYVVWFLVYVVFVPKLGYLPSTALFSILLPLRLGYRDIRSLGLAVLFGLAVILIFKALLHVNIPGGALYEYLPSGWRKFALTYL